MGQVGNVVIQSRYNVKNLFLYAMVAVQPSHFYHICPVLGSKSNV